MNVIKSGERMDPEIVNVMLDFYCSSTQTLLWKLEFSSSLFALHEMAVALAGMFDVPLKG